MRPSGDRRRGATTVECAVVMPIAVLCIFAPIIGGLGVFHYQQIALLAQESARWASVHGAQYSADTGLPAATATDIYQQAIVPQASGLDLNKLSYSVSWDTDNRQYHTVTLNGQTMKVANTVTVTVNYEWLPQAFVGGGTMSSTAVATMSY